MPEFTLDPRLAGDTFAVAELELCALRLMNDARYPWLVLVPRRVGMVEIFDLSESEQTCLYQEIRRCALALKAEVRPDKLNIAALGNQVSQLHVHVIARFQTDDAWPGPVWGAHSPKPYPDQAQAMIAKLSQRLVH